MQGYSRVVARVLRLGLLGLLLLPVQARAADYAVAKIAATGDPAPGTGGGTHQGLRWTALDDAGQVAFTSNVRNGTGICGTPGGCDGLYLGSPGSVGDLVLEGDAAPGTVSATHLGFFFPSLDDAGDVAYRGTLSGGPPSTGVFLFTGSVNTKLALAGETAPNTGGATYTGFGNGPSLGGSSDVAFRAQLTGGTATEGIFLASASSVSDIALTGGLAPDGGTWVAFGDPSINASGDIAYEASTTIAAAIFLRSGAVTTRLVKFGDPAPGTGGTLASFDEVLLNDAGDVAFRAGVSGASKSGGIFLIRGGTVQAVVLSGERAPLVGGGVFSTMRELSLNESAEVAFRASVSGGTSPAEGIFLARPFETRVPALAPIGWAVLCAALLGAGALAAAARRRT